MRQHLEHSNLQSIHQTVNKNKNQLGIENDVPKCLKIRKNTRGQEPEIKGRAKRSDISPEDDAISPHLVCYWPVCSGGRNERHVLHLPGCPGGWLYHQAHQVTHAKSCAISNKDFHRCGLLFARGFSPRSSCRLSSTQSSVL